jgi:prolipoprotein diacylglyceryltransferase
VSLLAAISSPSSNALELGPLKLNAYGLMIALGVILGVRIAGKALERRGAGTTDDFSAVAMWAVPAGVIGARAYHVITDWDRFSGNLGDAFKVWQGGLGIWGGIALGVPVGMWAARRRGLDVAIILTVAAPAIAAAQAVGRWGNWFNQELFGRPTDLPWALECKDARRGLRRRNHIPSDVSLRIRVVCAFVPRVVGGEPSRLAASGSRVLAVRGGIHSNALFHRGSAHRPRPRSRWVATQPMGFTRRIRRVHRHFHDSGSGGSSGWV